MQNVALVLGAILTGVGILSGITALIFVFLDRRAQAAKSQDKRTVAEGSLAMKEMELALVELGKMNRRIAEELDDCLRAKAALQACKDDGRGTLSH